MDLIIFTDLDGTLLDHETYDWAPAKPALNALLEHNIPLIMASSKTAAEIAVLRKAVGFEHCPAIVENGAGILPPGPFVDDQDPAAYRAVRDALADVTPSLRVHFTGFGDMSVEEIAEHTDLPLDAARLAACRSFSEPGIWRGDDAQRNAFTAELDNLGLKARYGGRYLTLSQGGTKAGRMAEIEALLKMPDAFQVALGDAPNDVEMLETADRGFIVMNAHANPLPRLTGEDDNRVTRTEQTGPTGWNDAVLSVLSQRTKGVGD